MWDPAGYERRVLAYLGRLKAVIDAPAAPLQVRSRLFEEFLAVVEMPLPEASLYPSFSHVEILKELAGSLHVAFNWTLREAIDDAVPRNRARHKETFYRVRRLSPVGSYPSSEFRNGPAWYGVHAMEPYMVTLNSARQEALWSYGSELSDWTRHETRLATALSCTEWGRFVPFLSRHFYDFPKSLVGHVDDRDRVRFLIELSRLKSHINLRNDRPRPWKPFPHSPDGYEFGDFRPFERRARRFASEFLVSHPLLLRTSRHYVKSAMLWQSDGFEEDALANLLFAMEGCLLLFQDIEEIRTDRLDRRFLRQHFKEVYEHGEGLYEWIEGALGWGGMRAQLVHPQLALSDGWKPFLMADDYYEHAKMVRAILAYLVTGETFEDYELVAVARR